MTTIFAMLACISGVCSMPTNGHPMTFQTAQECNQTVDRINQANFNNNPNHLETFKCFKKEVTTWTPVD